MSKNGQVESRQPAHPIRVGEERPLAAVALLLALLRDIWQADAGLAWLGRILPVEVDPHRPIHLYAAIATSLEGSGVFAKPAASD